MQTRHTENKYKAEKSTVKSLLDTKEEEEEKVEVNKSYNWRNIDFQ